MSRAFDNGIQKNIYSIFAKVTICLLNRSNHRGQQENQPKLHYSMIGCKVWFEFSFIFRSDYSDTKDKWWPLQAYLQCSIFLSEFERQMPVVMCILPSGTRWRCANFTLYFYYIYSCHIHVFNKLSSKLVSCVCRRDTDGSSIINMAE